MVTTIQLKFCQWVSSNLKKDELAGKMFDDELELAYAVIDGVQVRRKKGNYSTQRIKIKFNSLT